MSQKYVPKLDQVTKHPLIQQALELSETIYGLLSDMPDEEKWDTTAKLRQSANNLLFNIAKAVANAAPAGAEYDWSNARKEAAALLTMYRFAGKQGFLSKDTDVTLAIDKLIKQIDKEILDTYQRTEEYNRFELSVWQDKYDMWQKLNKEIAK